MQTKQGVTLALSSALPVAALAVYLLTTPFSSDAQAQASGSGGSGTKCVYASASYSVGACVRGNCTWSWRGQKCQTNGTWGSCESC